MYNGMQLTLCDIPNMTIVTETGVDFLGVRYNIFVNVVGVCQTLVEDMQCCCHVVPCGRISERSVNFSDGVIGRELRTS